MMSLMTICCLVNKYVPAKNQYHLIQKKNKLYVRMFKSHMKTSADLGTY